MHYSRPTITGHALGFPELREGFPVADPEIEVGNPLEDVLKRLDPDRIVDGVNEEDGGSVVRVVCPDHRLPGIEVLRVSLRLKVVRWVVIV